MRISEDKHYIQSYTSEEMKLLEELRERKVLELKSYSGEECYTIESNLFKNLIMNEDTESGEKCYDCLQNAEQIMLRYHTGRVKFDDEDKAFSCVADSKHNDLYITNESGKREICVIGDYDDSDTDTYQKNIRMINYALKEKDVCGVDRETSPKAGNAFFICRLSKYRKGIYPYHAATVILTIDNIFLTLETLADTQEWYFNTYSTDDSFHDCAIMKYYKNCKRELLKTVEIKLQEQFIK